jgi:hypothetical protein
LGKISSYLFLAKNFTKLKIITYYCFEKFKHFLLKHFILSSQKYGLGFRILIPDAGVKKEPDPGPGSATLLGGVIPTDNGGASVFSERHHGIHQRLRSVGELFELEHARRPEKIKGFKCLQLFAFPNPDNNFYISSPYRTVKYKNFHVKPLISLKIILLLNI